MEATADVILLPGGDRVARARAAMENGDMVSAAQLIMESPVESEVLRSATALLDEASERGTEDLWSLYQELAAFLGNEAALRNHAVKVGCWLGHIAVSTPDSGPCGHVVNTTFLEVIAYALSKLPVEFSGEVTLHLIGCTLEREAHLDLHRLLQLLKRRVAPRLSQLNVVMVGFFEDYSGGRRLASAGSDLASEAWRSSLQEKLSQLDFVEAEVTLRCLYGCYHDLELPTPDAAVLCNPGLEVHFASWAPTVRNLVQRAVPVVLVGSCAFQDLSCFDAAVSEPLLRWLGARIVVPSTCSPFPMLHMDLRLIALKGRETSGIPFRASDGFFCAFAGQDLGLCLDGTVPDTAAALLRCFMECVCRLEMLRDELIEPGETASVPMAVVEEPPHRAKIRSFFAQRNMELLPCTAQSWQNFFQELGMWPDETAASQDAVWETLSAKFWKRREELGAHRLREEAVSLFARAREAVTESSVPLPSGPMFEQLSERLETSESN